MLTSCFSYIAVQSKIDLEKYHSLGCHNVDNLGNLKFASNKLSANEAELESLKKIFSSKKFFIASSTHEMDETVLLDIICQFKKQGIDDFYPIIILRHPERAHEISMVCKKMWLKYSLRSSRINHNLLEDDIYIVDSFGELGLFYSLSYITVIGGSFKKGGNIGGHNLIEPAYFDNMIIVGPNMSKFQSITDEMLAEKACIQVSSSEELKIRFYSFLI